MPVAPLSGLAEVSAAFDSGPIGRTAAPGFADTLAKAVEGVDAQQAAADQKLSGLASGKDVDLHGTMIALEEANIALRAMGSMRDKVVEAYQAVWNMQI